MTWRWISRRLIITFNTSTKVSGGTSLSLGQMSSWGRTLAPYVETIKVFPTLGMQVKVDRLKCLINIYIHNQVKEGLGASCNTDQLPRPHQITSEHLSCV